jgi:Fe2+ transport system protein FeoA
MDMNRVIALSDLRPDQQAKVVIVRTKTAQELQSLMMAGILPNAQVNVMHRDGRHVLVFADCKELAVDREIAAGIYVEPGQ